MQDIQTVDQTNINPNDDSNLELSKNISKGIEDKEDKHFKRNCSDQDLIISLCNDYINRLKIDIAKKTFLLLGTQLILNIGVVVASKTLGFDEQTNLQLTKAFVSTEGLALLVYIIETIKKFHNINKLDEYKMYAEMSKEEEFDYYFCKKLMELSEKGIDHKTVSEVENMVYDDIGWHI